MNMTTTSFSPVILSYVAALRGIKANHPGEAFTYAMLNCIAPELLMGLAASNPEGRFYGLISDTETGRKATADAAERQVNNVIFINATASSLARNIAQLPPLDYLACDETANPLPELERDALFEVAAKCLKPGGLMHYNYLAYANPEDALRFIVREFAPEMDGQQASDFLLEVKKLGHLYLKSNPVMAAKLDKAIAKNMPDDFFALFDEGEARSATFDTMVALGEKGLSYAGSGNIKANYVELSVPMEAQTVIVSCSNNPLHQPMKDLASMSAMRSDIWCKLPAAKSSNPAELFGSFAYGIPFPENKIPSSVQVFGKVVDLSMPHFRKLISLMSLQPAGIGNVLQDTAFKTFTPAQVLESIQILVALGIARPMRGAREAGNVGSLTQPRFCGGFNRYIEGMTVTGAELAMASKVMGDVINISPQDALVMQALNRAGLANSVPALLQELQRLEKMPTSSAYVNNLGKTSAESANQMISDTVAESIVQWYAYGLLEAA